MEGQWKFQGLWVSKAKILKVKDGDLLEFPEGWGGIKPKNRPWQGYEYFLEQHICQDYTQCNFQFLLQWDLDLTRCQGTGEICSLYRGFVISKTSI